MTTYFVDRNVKKSGDGLTMETALKTEDEAWDVIESNAPQNVVVTLEPDGWHDFNPLALVRWYPKCPYCGILYHKVSDCCCPQYWPTTCDTPGCGRHAMMSRLYRGASLTGLKVPVAGYCKSCQKTIKEEQ